MQCLVFFVWDHLWEVFYKQDYKIEVRDPTVIIDIGGHIGITTMYFAKKYPEAQIITVEPNASSYKKLVTNIRLNNINNVKLLRSAVTNIDGGEMILYKNLMSGMSSVNNNNYGGEFIGREKVKTITLRRLLSDNKIRNVDLIKIDCEGCEFDILMNLESVIFRRIKNMIIEYHNSYSKFSHSDLKKKLVDNGFKVKIIKDINILHTGMIYASK